MYATARQKERCPSFRVIKHTIKWRQSQFSPAGKSGRNKRLAQPPARHVPNLLRLFYTVPLCISIHFISGISIMTHVSHSPSLPLLRLYLSHCLYVCLPRSLGNGPRALCAAMNDSSPSVAYVLGLENKRGGRRLAGCFAGMGGRGGSGREGDRGDVVARGGGLQQAPRRSSSGKNMTKRVFFF